MKRNNMIDVLRKGLFSLLFTFTLAMSLEVDNHISVAFNVWSPSSMDLDIVERLVSDALRSFLCEDAKLILLDTHFRSACGEPVRGVKSIFFSNMGKLAMLDFIKQTDPTRSYIVDEVSHVLISDSYETNSALQATTYDFSYEVLQVGLIETETARIKNFTDEMVFMEQRIQQLLNLSIIDGIMNYRLRETDIIMGKIGQQFGIFPEKSFTFEEENIYADPELDYKQSALILRYTGISLIIGSVVSSIILTYLGRRYRLDKKRKEMAALDPEYQRGLVTEQGVNLMLEKGRRESEQMSSFTSA